MKIKVFLYLGLLATTAVWGGAFLVMKDSLVRQDVYSFWQVDLFWQLLLCLSTSQNL